MKVLQLYFENVFRGASRQTLLTVQGLQDAGVEVALLCRKGSLVEKMAKESGFTIHAFDTTREVTRFLVKHGKQFDVLHAQNSNILTYCVITKPFHRAKVVFTRRVDFVPHGFLTWIKYKLTDSLAANSDAIKNIIKKFSGREVSLIYSALDPKKLDKQKAEAELAKQGITTPLHILGTMAALVGHKDPFTMVEAIRALKEKRRDFIFLHFGEGDLEAPVRDLIRRYELEDHYRLMGFYEQVDDFFSLLDVFVMSSEMEGLGSSLLDAFVYKVPVVSTDAGGLKELLKDGRGIMSKIKSPEELAEGINKVLNDPPLRDAMVQKAYDFAIANHSVAGMTQKYLHLYKS
jgi:glycosyltransferase involved in cell wall biosynthesis